jgi:hypothetical protein
MFLTRTCRQLYYETRTLVFSLIVIAGYPVRLLQFLE